MGCNNSKDSKKNKEEKQNKQQIAPDNSKKQQENSKPPTNNTNSNNSNNSNRQQNQQAEAKNIGQSQSQDQQQNSQPNNNDQQKEQQQQDQQQNETEKQKQQQQQQQDNNKEVVEQQQQQTQNDQQQQKEQQQQQQQSKEQETQQVQINSTNNEQNKEQLQKQQEEKEQEKEDTRTSTGIPKSEKPATQYVLRKSISKLSDAEFDRFFKAIRKMMESKDGVPGTSDFFRLAGYHGWPSDFCQHGTETFPVWHRAYLVDFEQHLIKADKALGNDGNIGIPYWDWSVETRFPEKILGLHMDFPEDFFPKNDADEVQKRFEERLFTRRNNMEEIEKLVISSQAALQAEQALLTTEHWKYASTRWRGPGVSVESSHNSIHMACGYPMTSIQFAAFDILFWLHHCNVDRYFEKYIQIEKDSYQEFNNTQRILQEDNNEQNRALEPLKPFIHPATGKDFLPIEGYEDTKTMLFAYDELPPTPNQQMREFPILAIFQNVDTNKLNKKSYLLHVFVTKQSEDFQFPDKWAEFQTNPNYAGWGAIFGGKGKECTNCKTKQPFNIMVELNKVLNTQQIKQHEAKLHIICQDEFGELFPFENTEGIPQPIVHGPFFEDNTSNIDKAQNNEKENKKLQEYLKMLGYYEDNVDGVFGDQTHSAIEKFQNFYNIEKDGIVGKETKNLLKLQRNDNKSDNNEEKANLKDIKDLKLYICTQPGYLPRKPMIEEILQGFSAWNTPLQLFSSIQEVEDKSQANVVIRFSDRSSDNLFLFDSVGGNLAYSNEKEINFDMSEKWLLQNVENDEKGLSFKFLPVLTHEIGHVLGLAHSNNIEDIMYPYYSSNKITPHQNDLNKVAQLYNIEIKQ